MNHDDDGPFLVIADQCEKLVEAGATIFQKFTCIGCRARQTMAVPNALYTTGSCDECGCVTDIRKEGCGFMLVQSSDPGKQEKFVALLAEMIAGAPANNRN